MDRDLGLRTWDRTALTPAPLRSQKTATARTKGGHRRLHGDLSIPHRGALRQPQRRRRHAHQRRRRNDLPRTGHVQSYHTLPHRGHTSRVRIRRQTSSIQIGRIAQAEGEAREGPCRAEERRGGRERRGAGSTIETIGPGGDEGERRLQEIIEIDGRARHRGSVRGRGSGGGVGEERRGVRDRHGGYGRADVSHSRTVAEDDLRERVQERRADHGIRQGDRGPRAHPRSIRGHVHIVGVRLLRYHTRHRAQDGPQIDTGAREYRGRVGMDQEGGEGEEVRHTGRVHSAGDKKEGDGGGEEEEGGGGGYRRRRGG
mmetsp:Transcript_19184/g.55827  ORF Transcript_19184/g.55827 Transcript_19184/m.55827 type:complete len:314 (-) Transcript_19184:638-1579(-)